MKRREQHDFNMLRCCRLLQKAMAITYLTNGWCCTLPDDRCKFGYKTTLKLENGERTVRVLGFGRVAVLTRENSAVVAPMHRMSMAIAVSE